MRHRVAKKHFNRDTNARKALLKNLLRSLVEQGSITTTTSKAKEIKRLMDKLVVKAQVGSVHSRRLLHETFGRVDVVNTLVDRVAPAMGDRKSGFTTLTKVGIRRGDNAELSKVQFVAEYDRMGTLRPAPKAVKETKKVAKKAPAKKAAAKKTTTKKVAKK